MKKTNMEPKAIKPAALNPIMTGNPLMTEKPNARGNTHAWWPKTYLGILRNSLKNIEAI